ncbi:MAG: hypothetical protein LBT98_04340 [Puniceicoccales bacterium]|nr:hypothetical protein [Puniceicoccales bacterium]
MAKELRGATCTLRQQKHRGLEGRPGPFGGCAPSFASPRCWLFKGRLASFGWNRP